MHWQWPIICKCTIYWVCDRVEMLPQNNCTQESQKLWPRRGCHNSHQRTSQLCKAVRPGYILGPPCILQHNIQCISTLSCRSLVLVALHTMLLQHILNRDQHAMGDHECLDEHNFQSAAHHVHWGCRKKTSCFTRQTVSVLNDARNMCLHGTVICIASNCSYLIKSLVEDSTDVPMTAFLIITQMLSFLTHPLLVI